MPSVEINGTNSAHILATNGFSCTEDEKPQFNFDYDVVSQFETISCKPCGTGTYSDDTITPFPCIFCPKGTS